MEGQHNICGHLPKTNVKRKSVPQSRVATRQQSPNAQAKIPFEERAPSTPKLQNMSRHPRNSWVSSDGETNCKHRRGLCTTASGGPLPHSPKDVLQCTEGEQKRGLQTKVKVQELKSWKKPGLFVLLMSSWTTSTRRYFCPSISSSLRNTAGLWTLFSFLLKTGGLHRPRAAHPVKSQTMYFETTKMQEYFLKIRVSSIHLSAQKGMQKKSVTSNIWKQIFKFP